LQFFNDSDVDMFAEELLRAMTSTPPKLDTSVLASTTQKEIQGLLESISYASWTSKNYVHAVMCMQ